MITEETKSQLFLLNQKLIDEVYFGKKARLWIYKFQDNNEKLDYFVDFNFGQIRFGISGGLVWITSTNNGDIIHSFSMYQIYHFKFIGENSFEFLFEHQRIEIDISK